MTLRDQNGLVGCGTPIGVHYPTTCGVGGLCVTCWQKKHDLHLPTIKAERDALRRANA